jgi:hypothetical protein
MSDMFCDVIALPRTEAFRNLGDRPWLTEAGHPIAALRADGSDFIVITPTDDHYVITGATLACRALLGDDRATSSRPPLLYQPHPEALPARSDAGPKTAAQDALAEIQAISALTNEEIAPLVGVSRRSIQAWRAGGVISARKERRLRSLLDAVRKLADITPSQTRERLLRRAPGDVSAYDLLAESRWEAAVDVTLGRRSFDAVPAGPQAQDLYAQLDRHEGYVDLPPERLDRRFSGRLRR